MRAQKIFSVLYWVLAFGLFATLVQMACFFGLFYVGLLAPLGLLAALTLIRVYHTRFVGKKEPLARFFQVMNGLCIAGFGALALLTAGMFFYAYHVPAPPPEDATVVVLGCRVNQDGTLSEMLRRRLDIAADYLLAHPESACITSGGQGPKEPGPEAVYMRDYLIQKGVAPERIYPERASSNTSENIRFSHDLLRQEGLSPRLVIATEGFHQLRAGYFAASEGLESTPLSCMSPWHVLPMYLLREYMGLAKAFFLHY